MEKLSEKLPAWAWAIVVALGLAGIIAGIIGIFFALATVEGVGSLVVIALIAIYLYKIPPHEVTTKREKIDNITRGFGLFFLALMATVIDQTGNFAYNKPIEWLYCRDSAYLTRQADVSNPLPGRTDITQDFRCVKPNGELQEFISPLSVMLVRFVEYVAILYAVSWLAGFISIWKARRKLHTAQLT